MNTNKNTTDSPKKKVATKALVLILLGSLGIAWGYQVVRPSGQTRIDPKSKTAPRSRLP